MLELSSAKKNKITLSDYNFKRDIENRHLMATFTATDSEVLEAILFSPIKTTVADLGGKKALSSLKKLGDAGLLQIDGETVTVDKEMRKYFEAQAVKFEDDFKPDMEYLQTLLRKVPIQILPLWYAIPRTSNNIFESLVEKYLFTPQLYHRYLNDLTFPEPHVTAIAHDVFKSDNFTIPASEIMKRYKLSYEQFAETMLLLEFSFVVCSSYTKVDDRWIEVITPFHEWKTYLQFLKETAPAPRALKTPESPFQFIQEAEELLLSIKKEMPIPVGKKAMVRKLAALQLLKVTGSKMALTEQSRDWLDMRLENRAVYIYRQPENKIMTLDIPHNERLIREAEKSITRVLHSGWLNFDEFLKGVTVSLSEQSVIHLKKTGRSWHYTLPHYTGDEKALIKAVIFEWLYEAGITMTTTDEGADYFAVTPFGQSLFG